MYLEALDWQLHKIRWDVVCFSLIPVSLFAFLLSVYHLTGSLFAPLQIQAAWGKISVMPWVTLVHPKLAVPYVTSLEQVLTIGCLLLGLMSVRFLRSMSYSVYTFLLLLPPLFSGTLVSYARYCVVIFPIFIVMAFLGKRRVIDQFFTMVFLVVQVLFMVAWSQFYWIG
jgi:hypothetical protein